MNDRVELNPDGLRRSANEFDDLADKTKKLLETLKSSSGSKGEAWGSVSPADPDDTCRKVAANSG